MRIRRNNIQFYLFCGMLLPLMALFTACDSNDESGAGSFDSNTQIVLTFVTPNDGTSTRAAVDDPDGYEAGVGYENDINISGSDYKIYFFSNTASDAKGGTLIAEFTPTTVTKDTDQSNSTTTYSIIGSVPTALMNVGSFKVVMLANWGWSYPSVTVGTTTIDDLCERANAMFYASSKFTIDADNLIPFYGVQEYSGVSMTVGETTTLDTPVRLLRAVAKVEVMLTNDAGETVTLSDVSIVNYNEQGYCAPWGVYTAADYDTEMNNNPSSGNWSDEWVKGLHLVGGKNDSDSKTQSFTKVAESTTTPYETWRIYLPEYDNTSDADDYSYIQVTVSGIDDYDIPYQIDYQIYFAEYTSGGTTNATNLRYDIKRNNLYRFYITVESKYIRVVVNKWDEHYDNEFNFGSEYDEVGSEP